MPSGDTVYHCLPKDQKPDMVCLEWMHRARLYLSYNQKEGFRCYRFTWQSLHPDTILTDCFENGGQYGHW